MPLPIEIRDPEIDAEALVSDLKRRLKSRREEGGLPPAPPDFALASTPEIPDATLHYHIKQMNATYDKVFVGTHLKASPVAHIPVVGKLWCVVRAHAHNLIVYYLDMLAAKQATFNSHITAALNRLIALETPNSELSQRVAALSERVQELEARIALEQTVDD